MSQIIHFKYIKKYVDTIAENEAEAQVDNTILDLAIKVIQFAFKIPQYHINHFMSQGFISGNPSASDGITEVTPLEYNLALRLTISCIKEAFEISEADVDGALRLADKHYAITKISKV